MSIDTEETSAPAIAPEHLNSWINMNVRFGRYHDTRDRTRESGGERSIDRTELRIGEFTSELQSVYFSAVRGDNPKYAGWSVPVY